MDEGSRSASPLARAWVGLVQRSDTWELPRHVVDGVLSCGPDAALLLEEMLGDPAVFEQVTVEHVVWLLGELRCEDTLQSLVDLLWDEDVSSTDEAIAKFGPVAVPRLLEAVKMSPRQVVPTLAACAWGTGDPRVREAVEALVRSHPADGAWAASRFGDPSLVPLLQAALAGAEAAQEVSSLREAIELLGGDLPGSPPPGGRPPSVPTAGRGAPPGPG